MAGGARERFFAALADWILRRPRAVLVVSLLLLVAAAATLPGLGVSTSRTGLVSNEDPQQQRMNAFYERFGRPDAPVFVVAGGSAEDRRAVVDRLQAALEKDPRFAGRVQGRIEPRDVAPIILLQQPSALAMLRARLPPGTDLVATIEGGLPRWLGLLEAQMLAGLDGADDTDDDTEPEAAAPPQDMEAQLAGLGRLATMARVLDDTLAGRDPWARLAGGEGLGSREGIDAHGYLVTASGDYHLVAVYPDLESDEGRVLEPLVTELRDLRDQALVGAPAEVTADLTGLPGISVDELRIVRQGLGRSTIATTLGIFALCLALFRSLRQTVVALLPLLPGVVLTLAVVRLVYHDLNLITSSFVAVLLGLGIDFAVHFIARRNEEVRAGRPEKQAVRSALVHTGPGIMTGAVVTAAAFLTTTTTDFTAYAQLGVITAVGLMVIMVATFVLLPALLVVGHTGKARAAPEPPGIGTALGVVRRLRMPVLLIGLLAGVAGGVALPSIQFNPRYFDFLPQRTESARALRALEHDAVASPVFAVLTAPSIEDARREAETLRGLESIAGVQSPSDLLPPLGGGALQTLRSGFAGLKGSPDFEALAEHEMTPDELKGPLRGIVDALDEVRFAVQSTGLSTKEVEDAQAAFADLRKTVESLDDAGLARLRNLHRDLAAILGPAWETAKAVSERGHYLPADVPGVFARRFVSKDGTEVAVFAVPAGDFWQVDVAERFSADVRSVDPEAVGLALIHVAHGQMILAGFQRAAAIAAVVIVVLLLIDFRRPADAMLALLPTALGWLWMVGLMVPLGLRFDVANIVALPLVLGIGIAFGVHTMHRLREEAFRAEGARPIIDAVVRGTGGAIAVAALTTMVGFGGLMISDYGGMRSLAAVMLIGIGSCLGATLLVLPALLLVLRRAE